MSPTGLQHDLRRLIGDAGVVDPADQSGYERGQRYGVGKAAAVVRPAKTQEVAAILRYCFKRSIQVVPQGANTGLVAAATPDISGEQLVLSLDRLRGVNHLDVYDRVATCAAGTRLSELNSAAEPHGLSLPIDLGADPSLGGMVATNTGGARLIRYGDMRRNLLGIEVVLADGEATVLSDLLGLRKNNTGLDLKQLFVGTGGTFGVITQVQVELQRIPKQSSTALIVPSTVEMVPALLSEIECRLGDFLTAADGISRNALEAALRHHPALRNPFEGGLPDYALLVEAATSLEPATGIDIDEIMIAALAPCLEGDNALAMDVRMGRGPDFWHIRHAISEGVKAEGRVIAFDIAVARSRLPALRETLLERTRDFNPGLRIFDFGHVGDGGMHFNLVSPAGLALDDASIERLREVLYDCVVRDFGGSFSAEHAIGPYNMEYYGRYTPDRKRSMTGSIRDIVNPASLLGSFDLGSTSR